MFMGKLKKDLTGGCGAFLSSRSHPKKVLRGWVRHLKIVASVWLTKEEGERVRVILE